MVAVFSRGEADSLLYVHFFTICIFKHNRNRHKMIDIADVVSFDVVVAWEKVINILRVICTTNGFTGFY